MKKLLIVLFAVLGLVIVDAQAHYRACGRNNSCSAKSACTEEVKTCAQACKVDRVIEQPCPALPCCERYVAVREPALVTKHISYSVSCPDGCTEAQKAVGMMHAGETWEQVPAAAQAK